MPPPPLSQLPGDLKVQRVISTLEDLGYIISPKGGKGSHIKMTCPANHKTLTIPSHRVIGKKFLRILLQEMEQVSRHTWDDFHNKLKG